MIRSEADAIWNSGAKIFYDSVPWALGWQRPRPRIIEVFLLGSLENPVFGGLDDYEVVCDVIAECLPFFLHFAAQEIEYLVTKGRKIVEASIMCQIFMHQEP